MDSAHNSVSDTTSPRSEVHQQTPNSPRSASCAIMRRYQRAELRQQPSAALIPSGRFSSQSTSFRKRYSFCVIHKNNHPHSPVWRGFFRGWRHRTHQVMLFQNSRAHGSGLATTQWESWTFPLSLPYPGQDFSPAFPSSCCRC